METDRDAWVIADKGDIAQSNFWAFLGPSKHLGHWKNSTRLQKKDTCGYLKVSPIVVGGWKGLPGIPLVIEAWLGELGEVCGLCRYLFIPRCCLQELTPKGKYSRPPPKGLPGLDEEPGTSGI